MKAEIYFLLTIDTEEEWDWSGDFPKPPFSLNNIKKIPELQEFCQRLEITPTYFVDYSVMKDEHSANILKKYFELNQCDLGAHLHPWCNPPIEEEINEKNSNVTNLEITLVTEKLKKLTNMFQQRYGVHPFSFRSGRWAMNTKIIHKLAELNYRIDSSVFPLYKTPYFSYWDAPLKPYCPCTQNFLKPSNSDNLNILEIPVSSGFSHDYFDTAKYLHGAFSSSLLRYFRLVGILWHLNIQRKIVATPEGFSAKNIIKLLETSIKQGNKLVHIFFHSSDLLPGFTPYVQSNKDLKNFYKTLESVVKKLKQKYQVCFITMREAYKLFAHEAKK